MYKRLSNLDTCFNVIRHITRPFASNMLADIDESFAEHVAKTTSTCTTSSSCSMGTFYLGETNVATQSDLSFPDPDIHLFVSQQEMAKNTGMQTYKVGIAIDDCSDTTDFEDSTTFLSRPSLDDDAGVTKTSPAAGDLDVDGGILPANAETSVHCCSVSDIEAFCLLHPLCDIDSDDVKEQFRILENIKTYILEEQLRDPCYTGVVRLLLKAKDKAMNIIVGKKQKIQYCII